MSVPIESGASILTASEVAQQAAPTFARRVLLDALFLGGLADALLRQGPGIGLGVWMAVFAVTLVYLVRNGGEQLRGEQAAWLATAVLFAGAQAWRGSMALTAFDFLAMLLALAILGATLMRGSFTRSILGQRVRDLVVSLGAIVKQVLGGVLSLVFIDSAPRAVTGTFRDGRARSVLRATLLTLPLLLVFGLLLGSADPLFEKLLSLPALDWSVIASHIAVAGFFSWVVGGWLRGALVDKRTRERPGAAIGLTLGSVEVTVVLGALVALFALFVGVQVGWLFGGERLVRSTTGLGYAEYARHGFFELVWVSLLVLPVLLGTRAAIHDDDLSAVRRYRALSMALLVLLGGIMTSALGRMGLYIHYYGLSADRLFASVFMLWLAMVFVWFGVTVLRGQTRDFVAGMTITGFLTLGALNVVNPEALVARVNISRAMRALAVSDSVRTSDGIARGPIDYEYLTSRLDGDAVPVIVPALLAPPISPAANPAHAAEVRERCAAVGRILRRWATGTNDARRGAEADWRIWNSGAWSAHRLVLAHERELRQVTCLDARGELPFGNRDRRNPEPGEQANAIRLPGLSGGSPTQ
jgi:uncharacterized protein DUF4153